MTSRCLTIHHVIDCAESMTGSAIDAVKNGIKTLINEANSDPVSLKTSSMSLITFSTNTMAVVHIIKISQFQRLNPVIRSSIPFGLALDLVSRRLNMHVRVHTTSHQFSENPDAEFLLPELLDRIGIATEDVHSNYTPNIYIMSRCCHATRNYIIKYEKIPKNNLDEVRSKKISLPPNNELYECVESYRIADFDFSSDGKLPEWSISSNSFVIPPCCPCCFNMQRAFDSDRGNIFCAGKLGRYTFTLCGEVNYYATTYESSGAKRRVG